MDRRIFIRGLICAPAVVSVDALMPTWARTTRKMVDGERVWRPWELTKQGLSYLTMDGDVLYSSPEGRLSVQVRNGILVREKWEVVTALHRSDGNLHFTRVGILAA